MRALIVGEVAATLQEIVVGVTRGSDSKVVVLVEGDGVDGRGEERVDVFIGKTQRELGLGISQKINTVSNGNYLGETKEIRFQGGDLSIINVNFKRDEYNLF